MTENMQYVDRVVLCRLQRQCRNEPFYCASLCKDRYMLLKLSRRRAVVFTFYTSLSR